MYYDRYEISRNSQAKKCEYKRLLGSLKRTQLILDTWFMASPEPGLIRLKLSCKTITWYCPFSCSFPWLKKTHLTVSQIIGVGQTFYLHFKLNKNLSQFALAKPREYFFEMWSPSYGETSLSWPPSKINILLYTFITQIWDSQEKFRF